MFLLFLSSCSTGGGSEKPIEFAPTVKAFRSYAVNIEKKKARFADVFESVELMQLEETAESLLGSVSNLTQTGEDLIFHDSNNGDIYVFTNEGKFQRKFNNKGGAEGQYGAVQDLWLSGDSIVVYDSKKRTAYAYSQNGDFLKSVKMPEGTGHIFPLGEGYVTDMTFAPATDSTGYLVWVLDQQLQTQNRLIPNTNRIPFPMGQNTNSFSHYRKHLIFKAVYADTTYVLDARKAIPFIQIDFGEKYLWKDKSLLDDMMAAMMAIPEGKGVWNYTPYIGSDFIYMTYDISLKKLAALIDRKTGNYVILNTFMKNEERYDLTPLAWNGDRLLFSLPSSSVSELLGEMDEGQWHFAEGTSLEGIASSENPVLMWVKFKLAM